MSSPGNRAILAEYKKVEALYVDFCKSTEDLVRMLLNDSGLRVHSVTSRAKSVEKLEKKLESKEKGYEQLAKVTDLAGLRIITYYEDEVDHVAQVIKSEFGVDEENSMDRRIKADPTVFGYTSLHYICSHATTRTTLGEYRRFSGLSIEIQIRSILQHAWAEMEHDAYDQGNDSSDQITRRFSRLAGLLELADQEFMSIRDAMDEYARSVAIRVSASVPDISDVGLNAISLESFIQENTLVKQTDQSICDIGGGRMLEAVNERASRAQLEVLRAAGYQTLQEVRSSLEKAAPVILRYIQQIAISLPDGERNQSLVPPGNCLYRLAVLRMAKAGKEALDRGLSEANVTVSKDYEIWAAIAIENAVKSKDLLD